MALAEGEKGKSKRGEGTGGKNRREILCPEELCSWRDGGG